MNCIGKPRIMRPLFTGMRGVLVHVASPSAVGVAPVGSYISGAGSLDLFFIAEDPVLIKISAIRHLQHRSSSAGF
jgi:hypothetical protein